MSNPSPESNGIPSDATLHESDATRTILFFSDDLLAVTGLQDSARRLGFTDRVIDRPEAIDGDPTVPEAAPGLTEPLVGPDAAFIRVVAEMQPALVLVDAGSASLPWQRWIQILKTSAATRRIPVIAYGPHVQADRLEQARMLGADDVITRGRLHSAFDEIVRLWARTVDPGAALQACAQPLSEPAQRGLDCLARAQYFEAHEHLEKAILAQPGPESMLYRALLQVAVTYLQIERGNGRGAAKMLLRMHQWLDPLPETCRGVDVRALKEHVARLRSAIDVVGIQDIEALDRSLLAPIPMVPSVI